MIPKIVHKTGKFLSVEKLPNELKYVYKFNQNNNKEYKFIYYNDEDCINIVKNFDPKVFEAYNILIPSAYKADIFRMVILYLKGGIYSDLPQKFLKPLKTFIDHSKDLICIQNMEIAFIAAKPKSKIIRYIIDYQVNNVLFRRYGSGYLDITGPDACYRAYNIFFKFSQFKQIDMGNHSIDNFNISVIGKYTTKVINNKKNKYIIDKDNKEIIKLYTNNYHNIMYKDKKNYGFYYNRKLVFNENINDLFFNYENRINRDIIKNKNKNKIRWVKKIIALLHVFIFLYNIYFYFYLQKDILPIKLNIFFDISN